MKILVYATSLLCMGVLYAGCGTCESSSSCGSSKICSPSGCAVEKKQEIIFITKEDVQKMMKEKGVVLVDVLSSESYAKGHIKGAISIPLNELEKKIGTLNKADKIIVYCASKKCQASVKAAKLLIKHGFKNVYDYKSGLKEWIESGLPISAKKDK